MARSSKPMGWLLLLLCLSFTACSRPGATGESREDSGQSVPFRAETATSGPSDPTLVVPTEVPVRSSAVPFADSQVLPAGTLLNVRLESPISSAGAREGSTFSATVDEAVVSEGLTLVPRGAIVEGRIESAIASPTTRSRGFVRLTLDSIEFGGRDVPMQTSSLFARGRTSGIPTVQGASLTTVRLESGRRLTFRLTEPVSLSSQVAKFGH